MKLGVCWYPEQWPEHLWASDVQRMAAMGLSFVRIGEFAWSRIEPEPGRFDWGWLDRAVDLAHAAGLEVVMGTPTATPPKWLVDAHPEILAKGRDGQVRGFGSRRHYCFSSDVYLEQAKRITALMADRYGQHPAVVAWQTDNEYGCHDTVVSTSDAAKAAFRRGFEAQRDDVLDALRDAAGV
jgi:beta-galactosidase